MASPGERSKAESGDDGGGEAEVTVELEPVVVQEAQVGPILVVPMRPDLGGYHC